MPFGQTWEGKEVDECAYISPRNSVMNPAYAFDGRGTVYRPIKASQYNNNNNVKRRSFPSNFGNHRRHPHSISSGQHLQGQGQQPPTPEPVAPPNANPDKLMELLKSSGEYDRLRKQIFTTFQNSVSHNTLHVTGNSKLTFVYGKGDAQSAPKSGGRRSH